MRQVSRDRKNARVWRRSFLIYPIVAALALIVEFIVFGLWQANLGHPFVYSGDAAFSGALVKGMVESGRLWVNTSLGAPGALNLLDYPSADLLHHALMKIISLLHGNWAFAINIYYLLGYPAAAVTAAWAMRRFGLSAPSSVAMGLLYAFLPYHLFRNEGHLFLSAYYMVPLLAVLAVELASNRPPLVDVEGPLPKLRGIRARETWLPLVVCVLAGGAGIYYVFFGAFFLMAGGVIGWWQRSDRTRLYAAGLLTATMLTSCVLNLAPFIWFRHVAGVNPAVGARSAVEAEIFSLKITHILLPTINHRVPFLASIRESYLASSATVFGPSMIGETSFVALGVVGSLGFLLLIWLLIFGTRKPRSSDAETIAMTLARFNGAGLLLATWGGFGALIALGFPQIRAYNRIIVFLGLFAFFGVGWALDRITDKVRPAWRATVLSCVLIVVTVIALFDQIPTLGFDHKGQTVSWHATESFVRRVEEKLPSGAMVLQLPYVPFPENPPVEGMTDYDHFKPYLVSTKIHWSYGAVKGREDAEWLARVSALPAEQLVTAVSDKGFKGVWVDRFGYADTGSAIIAALEAASGTKARLSADGRYAFIALAR